MGRFTAHAEGLIFYHTFFGHCSDCFIYRGEMLNLRSYLPNVTSIDSLLL